MNFQLHEKEEDRNIGHDNLAVDPDPGNPQDENISTIDGHTTGPGSVQRGNKLAVYELTGGFNTVDQNNKMDGNNIEASALPL